MNKLTVTLLFTLVISACATNQSQQSNNVATKECKVSLTNKWYITSAEKKALYSEIFSLSKPVILANKKSMVKNGEQCGVILDIDETLLDNYKYQYMNDKQCTSFNPDTWNKFVQSQVSIALPRASDITHYIHSIGCKVNLVSGRATSTLKATEDNLNRENIYFDQVVLSNDILKTDKNPRFNAIINGATPSKFGKQTIIAYYGDSIEDFPKSNQALYNNENESANFDKFGKIYFVLPNPVYGSWLMNTLK